MRLGIDMDGVLADFSGSWRRLYEEQYGPIPPTPPTWDGFLEVTHFDTSEQFFDWLEHHEECVFGTATPDLLGISALAELEQRGFEIILITSKPDWAVESTREWIKKWEVPHSELHISYDKSKIPCAAYLDDGPHNIIDFVKNTDAVVCRWVQPWNYHIDGSYDIHSWGQFIQLMGNL